ncbi:MAG: FprA family A-type flavoprotein [Prevotellaceae bacterium]|jgi:flavorubredoxin|nr:FprA family A-type flavoprotein [Prevotellaceae bacterium]
MKPVQVCNDIYVISVNDRRKQLFENMWPLPYGVAYNCYMIDDEKTALLDTVELGSTNNFMKHVDDILKGRQLDYLIINHMEPDHSGEIQNIIAKYPNVKIAGNKQTFKIIETYFNHAGNLIEVTDGCELNLGKHKLKFVTTPMVHWPESMMAYDTETCVLFSQDAFGSFGTLDGKIFDGEANFCEDEMRRYYSNIVGKYSAMVQKAFAKLQGFQIKIVCPLHGIVWRENPAKVMELYNKWSRYESEDGVLILFASMYGNTEQIADHVARKIVENGVNNLCVYDVSKTHVSYLMRDAWKYKTIVLGSCSYNGEMHPMMEMFCREIEHYGLKNHAIALFGTGSWSGGGLRSLQKFAENTGWEQIAQPIEIKGIPDNEKIAKFDIFAKSISDYCKKQDNLTLNANITY